MENKKVVIFIDGGNFYFKLKEMSQKLGKRYSLLDFRFKDFCNWLVGEDELVEIRYYLGAVKRVILSELSTARRKGH